MNRPDQVSRRLVEALAAEDLDAIAELYETDAVFADTGGAVRGAEAIRTAHQEFIDSGLVLRLRDSIVLEAGGLALVHWSWTVTGPEGESQDGSSAEVLRRQADGSWRFVIDNSDGAALIGLL